MSGGLAHAMSGFTAAFLASLVEAVEALTVVLAVGATRGWRNALAGTAAALIVLAGLVLALGPAAPMPNRALLLIVGVLTLLFGLRWLRKAILRAAGLKPLHDETAAFARAKARLGPGGGDRWDATALAAAFQVVMMEGIEVVFIVAAITASGGARLAASWGAAAALAAVVAMGVALHRPLARVPENTLKFAVGAMMCGFGCFWTGEAIGVVWSGTDLALPGLSALWLAAGLGLVFWARPP
jgi:uncharacterized membrane protein